MMRIGTTIPPYFMCRSRLGYPRSCRHGVIDFWVGQEIARPVWVVLTRVNQDKILPSRKYTSQRRSRALGFYSLEYILRFLRNVGPLFDFDYERMIIAFSVSLSNIQSLMTSERFAEFASLDALVPAELQRPVTRSAIARSTGLPRETVRRKIERIIETGILISDDRGGLRLRPGIFATVGFVAATELNEADVRRLLRQLRHAGDGSAS